MSETTKTTVSDEVVTIQCGKCGTYFGMQKSLRDRRVADHETFYCPNGHGRVYSAPKVDPIDAVKADLTAATKRAEDLTAWVKRAPHLDICDVRVGRDCDCGRKALVGDVEAPTVTAGN